jgi:hypothetical protein
MMKVIKLKQFVGVNEQDDAVSNNTTVFKVASFHCTATNPPSAHSTFKEPHFHVELKWSLFHEANLCCFERMLKR